MYPGLLEENLRFTSFRNLDFFIYIKQTFHIPRNNKTEQCMLRCTCLLHSHFSESFLCSVYMIKKLQTLASYMGSDGHDAYHFVLVIGLPFWRNRFLRTCNHWCFSFCCTLFSVVYCKCMVHLGTRSAFIPFWSTNSNRPITTKCVWKIIVVFFSFCIQQSVHLCKGGTFHIGLKEGRLGRQSLWW